MVLGTVLFGSTVRLGSYSLRCTIPNRHVVSYSSSVKNQYFVTCHPGLEDVVSRELAHPFIGAKGIVPGKAGVAFQGEDESIVFRANLWLRSAIRVLELLAETDLDPEKAAGDTIYDSFQKSVDWVSFLKPGQTFSVDARTASNSNFRTSQLVVVRARDAICDALRFKWGSKPQPPRKGRCADLPLFATVYQDRLTIYRDTSGHSLHRRGYRQVMHRASLNESAAAGCLYLSGWADLCGLHDHRVTYHGSKSSSLSSGQSRERSPILADPMMGSGTFLIEAALMASCTAPGCFRKWWPFFSWPEFDRALWNFAFEQAMSVRKRNAEAHLWGNDIHAGALSLAARDADAAGVRSMIEIRQGTCESWVLPRNPDIVITNPPWGQRLLGEREVGKPSESLDTDSLERTWGSLGYFLKHQAGGSKAYILSGNSRTTQYLRLKSSRKLPLSIGGTDCRLLEYSINSRNIDKKHEE